MYLYDSTGRNSDLICCKKILSVSLIIIIYTLLSRLSLIHLLNITACFSVKCLSYNQSAALQKTVNNFNFSVTQNDYDWFCEVNKWKTGYS